MKSFFSQIKTVLPRLLKGLWGIMTRRLWLKLLSLLLAVLLWTYIISTTPSLTRTRTISGISVTSLSASALSSYTLAAATDVAADYASAVEVSVELPQSQYSRLTARNIRVTPDYTGIRAPGVYEVPLVATSTYGTVTSISPATISVTIDNLDSRVISVEPVFLNEDTDAYWYGESQVSLNPEQITVSGPASLVQTVSKAQVEVDAQGRTGTIRRSLTLGLVDANDAPVTSRLLTRSSNTCYVSLDIYPKKALGFYADPSQIKVAEGYRIDSISFQPAQVTVAGEGELLDAMDYLPLDIPESAEVSASFSKTLPIPQLDDFKYSSARSVYMTVNISPVSAAPDDLTQEVSDE